MKLNRNINILIIGGALSHNHGAEAMTISTVKLVLEFLPNSYIYISSARSSDSENILFKQNKNIDFLYENNNKIKIIWRIIKLILNKILKFPLTDKYLSIIKKSDLIIDVSGDTLSDIYFRTLITTFWRYFAALIFKKSLILFPQTIGPFNRISSRFISKFILENSKLIFLRENLSYIYLKSFIKKPKLVSTLDTAFYLEKAENLNLNSIVNKEQKLLIGISLSQRIIDFYFKVSRKKKKKFFESYITTIVNFIELIIEQYGVMVILIPHVVDPKNYINDDRIIQKLIYDRINKDYHTYLINIVRPFNAEELKYIISECDLFLGFRMHSNIAALSSNVPTIAVSYSHKYKGIMKIYGLENFVINISDLNLKILVEKFLEIYKNKSIIRKNLARTNHEIIEKNKKLLIQNTINCLSSE